MFVSDVACGQLLCELVKPTVDLDALGQPLQPLSFTAADGGRTIFAVGQYTHTLPFVTRLVCKFFVFSHIIMRL